jgi:hypothetical protein
VLGLCKMVKTRGWERLQGQLSDDQPGQDKLRCPCRHRKIWRKEPKQTIHYRIFEV